MLRSDFRRLVAVALVLTITFITLPVSAADFTSARSVIGSVSAVGAVDLRGVGISQEGTLFAGDSIRAHEKGYAKVLRGTGSKIEVSEKTDLTVNRDSQGVKIAMNSGIVGFTASSPLRVDIMPFEVTATDGASGNVSVMSSTTAGVRALSGKVTVRNLKTSESFVLTKGQEQLLGLQNGVHAKPLAEVASNVPMPLPAPGAPQTPAGKTSNPGLAMDTGAWLAVIGGAAIGGIAIWALVEAHNNHNDIDSLNSSIKSLNSTIAANQAATTAQLKAISNATNLAIATAQQAAALSQASALAVQAQLALTAAGNSSGATQFANLQTQIATNQAALNDLQSQISAAQAAVAAGNTAAQATLTSLLAQEETRRQAVNALILQERNLLQTFGSTPGVPSSGNTPGQVGGPSFSSASVPV
jgi:hypothetical protein